MQLILALPFPFILSSTLFHLWLAPQQEASELIWGERDNAAIPQE